MDIKNTYLFNSIRNIVHRHIPMIYEQINRNFSVFEKDIWEDLEQVEVILQNETYWGINADLSNMIFDAETLTPVGTVLGRIRLEHYSHWDYIELSYYICNLLSSAYNDFYDSVITKHRINIQDLNNKKKMVPYLELSIFISRTFFEKYRMGKTQFRIYDAKREILLYSKSQ